MASAAMQIMTIKESQGKFEGSEYHNFTLYCVNPVPSKGVIFGPTIEVIKIKAEDFFSALERNLKSLNNSAVKSVEDLSGLMIRPFYSKFGGQGIVYSADDFILSLGETAPANGEKKK